MKPLRPAPALLVVLLGACAPTGATTSTALETTLRRCGLLTEGPTTPSTLSAFYVPDACYAACLAAASCDNLGARLCGTSIELAVRCDERCAHRCADGSLVAPSSVCNGFENCADASDEAGCPTFVCRDGLSVSAAFRCDGSANCPHGDDEQGCPNRCTAVGGGYTLERDSPYVRCTGREDCIDGSDERDCGSYTCESGDTVHAPLGTPFVCDAFAQCWDGSDEVGCPAPAQLTPHCGP